MPRVPIVDYSPIDRLAATLKRGADAYLGTASTLSKIDDEMSRRAKLRSQEEARTKITSEFQQGISPRRAAFLKDATGEREVPLGYPGATERMEPIDEFTRRNLVDKAVAGSLGAGLVDEAKVFSDIGRGTQTPQRKPNLTNERFTINKPDGTQEVLLRWYEDGKFLRDEKVSTGISKSGGDGDGDGKGAGELYIYDKDGNPTGIGKGVTPAQIGVEKRALDTQGKDLGQQERDLEFQHTTKTISDEAYSEEKEKIARTAKYITAHLNALRKRAEKDAALPENVNSPVPAGSGAKRTGDIKIRFKADAYGQKKGGEFIVDASEFDESVMEEIK